MLGPGAPMMPHPPHQPPQNFDNDAIAPRNNVPTSGLPDYLQGHHSNIYHGAITSHMDTSIFTGMDTAGSWSPWPPSSINATYYAPPMSYSQHQQSIVNTIRSMRNGNVVVWPPQPFTGMDSMPGHSSDQGKLLLAAKNLPFSPYSGSWKPPDTPAPLPADLSKSPSTNPVDVVPSRTALSSSSSEPCLSRTLLSSSAFSPYPGSWKPPDTPAPLPADLSKSPSTNPVDVVPSRTVLSSSSSQPCLSRTLSSSSAAVEPTVEAPKVKSLESKIEKRRRQNRESQTRFHNKSLTRRSSTNPGDSLREPGDALGIATAKSSQRPVGAD
jgi:hypothetical protein